MLDPVAQKRLVDLSAQLRCLVCQNQSIAESNAELAVDLRNQINEQIKAGRSDKEIVDFMVTRYGDFVLYRPPFKATTALLWIGPIALLLLAVFVFYRTLVSAARARRRPAAYRGRACRGTTPARHRPEQQERIVTAFIAIATVMVVIALAWLLWPLLRARSAPTVERHVANASIYRDQFADLDADLRRGTISEARYAEARKAELERRLLDEGRARAQSARRRPEPVARHGDRGCAGGAAGRRADLLEARRAGRVLADGDRTPPDASHQLDPDQVDGMVAAAGRAAREGTGERRGLGDPRAHLLHDAQVSRGRRSVREADRSSCPTNPTCWPTMPTRWR